jgi:hypothetical protein
MTKRMHLGVIGEGTMKVQEVNLEGVDSPMKMSEHYKTPVSFLSILNSSSKGGVGGTGSKRQVIRLLEELEVKGRKGLWLTHNRCRGGSGETGFGW